jgi:hypothetical protein
MQRSQNKWNCESIKIIKNEITDSEFNEKLERVWELLQGLNCQPQNIFHLENSIADLSEQDQKQNWRAA